MPQTNPAQTNGLYRRLLGYAFVYKAYFALAVLGFALFAAMEASLIKIVKFFIQQLQGDPTDPLLFIPSDVTGSIYFVPVAIVVLSVFRGIGSYLGNFHMSKIGLQVVNVLRKNVFSQLVYLPLSFYDQRNSGELVSLIIYNIEQVTGSVTEAIKILMRDGFSVLFILFFLLSINWKLTLVFFSIAPLLGSIIYLASRYFRKTSRRIQSTVGQVTHIATETFKGIRLVKSFRGEKYENKRFAIAADNNLRLSTKYARVNALQTPIMHIIIALALSVIFFLVIYFRSGDAADAVVYVIYAGAIAKPFRQLSTINSIIQKGMAASETIFAAIDHAPEIDSGKTDFVAVHGRIEFNDVSFGYSGDNKALDKLNLTIEPGETVALVGESGSGKTTIASLLLRFYRANQGSILIDGTPISDISLASLRRNVALVNQQTILFNDSISANIAYGEDAEANNQEEIIAAAKNAYAKQFIEKLDKGFDTRVGEDGALLSGGQRQRLAIARALLKNAPILILDEATSALDNESEKQIQKALETLKNGRTTLIIAHRLSTIEKADKIVVLDKGRVIEVGNHNTLMALGGAYANLHRTQSH
ncbi:MAG: subfamily B ATP-binding cassette protein MsbA [Lentisphaeria bacterium]|jgi:subfamily B ATP-binding cassette protein MsbA